MIEKRLVQWYATDTGVDLDISEREVALTYVLRVMLDHGLLKHLAFKGGTAIRKLHLGNKDDLAWIWISPQSAILTLRSFTVNIPSEKYFEEADFVGMVSGRECDKFKQTRLTPEKSKLVNPPIVQEFPYALECNLVKQVDLGTHTMFIGEIVGIVADREVLSRYQLPDIEKMRLMLFGSFGSMAYYKIGEKLGEAFSVGNKIQSG